MKSKFKHLSELWSKAAEVGTEVVRLREAGEDVEALELEAGEILMQLLDAQEEAIEMLVHSLVRPVTSSLSDYIKEQKERLNIELYAFGNEEALPILNWVTKHADEN